MNTETIIKEQNKAIRDQEIENLEEGDVLITEDGQVIFIKWEHNDVYMLQIEIECETYPTTKGRQIGSYNELKEELEQVIKHELYFPSKKKLKQLIKKNNFRLGLHSSKAIDLIIDANLDWEKAKEYLNGLEVYYRGETYFFRKDIERFILR